MKSLMLLWQEVARDRAAWCNVSTDRDCKTVAARVEHEGDEFLTITLPNFAKDLERALAEGRIADDHFPGFTRCGGLPAFLGGFLQLVFDRSDGRLLDVPDVDAIQALRQLALLCGKVARPCSPKRVRAAYAKYIECEKEVREADAKTTVGDIAAFSRLGLLLYGRILSRLDREVYDGRLLPKHGPGAVAERGLAGNRKFEQLLPGRTRKGQWTERLERVFPYGEYVLPNFRYWRALEHVDFLEPGAESPVRVITVPKTQKTPRIIAIEPTCMQYAQQALWGALRDEIERDDCLSHFIGFSDSESNRAMAREASVTGDLATLDLSEASDRVSYQHVRALVRNHHWLALAVDASRSRKADVPGYPVQRLAKYASMGSATCFPFEAMVFTTVVFQGIEDSLRRPLTRSDVLSLRGRVRIYGDDILVPVEYADTVMKRLEAFGFVVNTSKSFWTGKFRESCGGEFFNGHDVTVVRAREDFPTSRQETRQLVSLVSLRNQFWERGYWRVVKVLDEHLRTLLRNHYPVVTRESAALGRWSVFSPFSSEEGMRDHRHLQTPLVKAYVQVSTPPQSALGGVSALTKCLSGMAGRPSYEGHLEFSGRPESSYTQLRWVSPA